MKNKTIKYIYYSVILIFLIYLGFQIFYFISAPKIEIYNFSNSTNFVSTTDKIFVLKGRVNGIKNFFISNQKIFLNKDLEFEKEIILFEGLNKISLKGVTEDKKIIEKNQ